MTPEEAKELGLEPATEESEAVQETFEIIPYVEPEVDPSKTGNKPKKLVAVEVLGYEVGRGLRKKVVTPEEVFKLAALGCTDKEIALWFDVAYETLRYNFSDIIAKGRQEMKTALRNAMFKNAMSGNAALQIFLAKNMLGMSDNPNSSQDDKPLPWND
jgi:DNA-binding NarL/FixJ family response regulator